MVVFAGEYLMKTQSAENNSLNRQAQSPTASGVLPYPPLAAGNGGRLPSSWGFLRGRLGLGRPGGKGDGSSAGPAVGDVRRRTASEREMLIADGFRNWTDHVYCLRCGQWSELLPVVTAGHICLTPDCDGAGFGWDLFSEAWWDHCLDEGDRPPASSE